MHRTAHRASRPDASKASKWRLGMGATAAALAAAAPALAQQAPVIVDNFNDNSDAEWTQYDPFAQAGVPVATYGSATLPNYRIQTAPSPAPAQLGPGRAGAIREDAVLMNFFVSVDLVDWNDANDQAWGILSRLQDVGLAATDGYAFTYANDGPSIDISQVTNEDPTGLAAVDVPRLDPTRDYRLSFAGVGENLIGHLYDLSSSSPNTPIATATAVDAAYTAAGTNGLVTFDNTNQTNPGPRPTDATFDNFLAREPLGGDANLDGTVNVSDLGVLATNFNGSGNWLQGDFNNDGTIDVADLGALATNFNQTVYPAGAAGQQQLSFAEAMALPQFADLAAAVPEPSSAAALLAPGGLGLLRARRRRR